LFRSSPDFSRKQNSLIGRGAHVDAFGEVDNRSGFLFRENSPTVSIPGDIRKAAFADPPQQCKSVYPSQSRYLAGFVELLPSDFCRHSDEYMQLYAQRYSNLPP
jgi:hypothetical protein